MKSHLMFAVKVAAVMALVSRVPQIKAVVQG